MISATLDGFSVDHHLSTDSLPFIDLRLLSQSELYSLSLCSSSSFFSSRCDPDLLIPKIDRSVFNESAGSRKQTFSRLRLAPRNSQTPISHPHHHIFPSRQIADPADLENARIISLLKQLFSVDSSCNADGYGDVDHDLSLVPVEVQFNESVPGSMAIPSYSLPIDVVDGAPRKRKRGRPRKNETFVTVNEVEKGNNRQGTSEPITMVNDNGDLVDLASLAILDDPLGEELKKRTKGMETESELLEFMGRLNGEWVSQRKKRRIVQACNLSAFFPRGWKIMLSLKRKAGHVRLSCRRFISPDGHQFVSCKEVASFLLTFFGVHNISSSIVSQQEGIAPFPTKMNSRNDATFTPKKDMDACHISSNLQIHISSTCPDHHPHMDPGIERHNDTRDKFNSGMNPVFSCRKEYTAITSEACTGRDYSGCIKLDDKMENAELATNLGCKTNFHLLATASFLNESNLVHEHLDELNLLRVTSNEPNYFGIPEERSGSCSLLRSENKQVCDDDNKVNIRPKISVEESVQEFISQSCSFSPNFQKKHASSVMKNEHVTCSMKDVNISDCQLDNEKSGYVSTDVIPFGSSGGSQVARFPDECEHAYHNKRNGDSAAILVGPLKVSNTEGGLIGAATGEETYVVVSELNNSLSKSNEVKEIITNFSLRGSLEKADPEMQEKGSNRNFVSTSSTEHAFDFGAANSVESAEEPKLTKISLKNTEFSTSIKQGGSEACAIVPCSLYTKEPSYAVRMENDVLHVEEELKNKKVEDCETSVLFSSFSCNNGDSDSGNVRNNILDVSKDSSHHRDSVGHSFGFERDFEASSNSLYGDVKTSSALKNSSWVDAMGAQKQQQADDIIKARHILSSGKHAHTSIASNCDFSSRKDGENSVTYTSSSHMSLPCSPKSDIMENKEECHIISVRDLDNVSICYGPRSNSTGIFYSNSLSLQTNPLVEQLENLMRDAEADRENISSGYLGFDNQKVGTLKQANFSEKSHLQSSMLP